MTPFPLALWIENPSWRSWIQESLASYPGLWQLIEGIDKTERVTGVIVEKKLLPAQGFPYPTVVLGEPDEIATCLYLPSQDGGLLQDRLSIIMLLHCLGTMGYPAFMIQEHRIVSANALGVTWSRWSSAKDCPLSLYLPHPDLANTVVTDLPTTWVHPEGDHFPISLTLLAWGESKVMVLRKEKEREEKEACHIREGIKVFSGFVAHELNNVLMILTTYLALLNKVDSPTKEILKALEEGVDRGKGLASLLIQVAGKGPCKKEPILFNAFLKDRPALFNWKNLKCEHLIEDKPLWIEGDKKRLEELFQTLQELYTQGLSPGDWVVVEVAEKDGVAQIILSDTRGYLGGNSPKDWVIPKDKHFRLLKIAGMMDQFGGTMRIEGERGLGSTLTLSFPMKAPLKQKGRLKQKPSHPLYKAKGYYW